MINTDYLKYALRVGLPKRLKFFFSTMSLNPTDNDYLVIRDNKYYVKIGSKEELITNIDSSRPLLLIQESITLSKDDIANVKDKVDTTVGRALTNYLLLAYPFGSVIPYINSKISIDDIERDISRLMREGKISTEQFIKYADAASLLQSTAKLVTVAATYKNMLPPPHIAEFKAKVRDYLNKKYGKEWIHDQVYIAEYQKILSAYDNEWLKDDPSYGKIASGKVTNQARPKMYLTFGAELGFDETGKNPQIVDNSLAEGYPQDEQQLTAMFNSSRAGSYSRGFETQKGGVIAKAALRATNGITIEDTDCGSTVFKEVHVTEGIYKALEGRYMQTPNGIAVIKDPKQYIGQTIYIRSPLYCKLGGKHICATCAGEAIRGYKDAVSLLVTKASSVILSSSLKAMHGKKMVTIDFNTSEAIKD